MQAGDKEGLIDRLSLGDETWEKKGPYRCWKKSGKSVDMVNIPLSTGFCRSEVVQDFFHQQYCFTMFDSYEIGGKIAPMI